MISGIKAYAADRARHPMFWAYCFSLIGHLALFAFILYTPGPKSDAGLFPSVIDVQIVDVKSSAPAAVKNEKVARTEAPVEEKADKKESAETAPSPEPAVQKAAEVSVAPAPHRTKTALKYKTMKSQKVLQNALEQLEKKVETAPPKPLADTIRRLREKVAKEGRPDAAEPEQAGEATATGPSSGIPGGGRQQGELIDMYRLEIAYAIQKHWAYSDQMAGGRSDLVASIVIKVMPDGRIADIFFVDRSGDPYLDDSAYKAIVKANPVKPHPSGLNLPYIEMGIRFTPKGVQ